MTLPFEGMTALVTGASSGIGRATSLALAKAGANVAINYWTMPESAESAAVEIRALGRQAQLFKVDVSDPVAVQVMVDEIVRLWGRLDLFVSSAVFSERESFLTANLDGFKRTIDVSMMGAYYSLRSAANAMLASGHGGSAVIVSSPHAEIAFPNCMAYNMAKAANDQMMRTAATELLSKGIRVNSVYPGWTDTPGERKFASDAEIAKGAAKQPLGRLAHPDEITRAILFLLDPGSGFITGTIMHVDGGLFLPWWSNRGSKEGF
jgi:glucose 1-dehydrogenase